MRNFNTMALLAATLIGGAAVADDAAYSWRYYRPGNTGIQGDWNEALWIDSDGNPWIGGYTPVVEEGGFAKFVVAEKRWLNVSNVDYPVLGSANEVGLCRVTDMVADDAGNLWLGTWRGVLRMNLVAGPASLAYYGPWNSPVPGGVTEDVTRAPDGSIWVSAQSSSWGGGGLSRYNPATNQWSHIDGHGGGYIAAQPKPGGGYYVWATGEGFSPMERWDSTTQTWASFPFAPGNPSHLASLDSADDAGNVWMLRWIGDQGVETLDCRRPDGTWLTPPLPPVHPVVGVAALRAFGTLQALMVDGYAHLHRFDGAAWTDLGPVPHSGPIDDLDIDATGNIWLCGTGTGGALRRDAQTGGWQRYRITNTSQFDLFNNDVAVDPRTGDIYACANASPGVGGMVRFDGTHWTGFVNEGGDDLTEPWPWPGAPQSEAVLVRPSTGNVVANPINTFTHEYDGTSWTALPGGPDQVEAYAEDSRGRLWGLGHYGGLGIYENGAYRAVDGGGWSGWLRADPVLPGAVWANEIWKVARTDGATMFSRSIEDFPGLTPNASSFEGLAVAADGVAWVGASMFPGGMLIRLDAEVGTYQTWRSDQGWPFPADHVTPLAVTPDGRVWMSYSRDFPSTDAGLLWWDGTEVGIFPAPPEGAWQWGGLPHAGILDLEIKPVPGGYELWMSCMTRGLAVLSVQGTTPVGVAADIPASFSLAPAFPNPFNPRTTLRFTLDRAQSIALTIFDARGRRVRSLVSGATDAGPHAMTWDGCDDGGRACAAGVYVARLQGDTVAAASKLMLVR